MSVTIERIVYLLGSVTNVYGQIIFIDNSGSYLLSNSIAAFKGHTVFYSSSELMKLYDTNQVRGGGAITLFKSEINTITMAYNFAENGGALHVPESKVYIYGDMIIAHDSVNDTGGGIYLDMSELNCRGNSSLQLTWNTALTKGGGVHAIS